MIYYIYKIQNLINNKIYIGLTNNIERRRNRHFSDLRNNRHDNNFLQKEFNIYGEENFSFEVIFGGDVSDEEIGDKEKFYIKYYDSYKNGYNQNEGGNFGPSNGGSQLVEKDIFEILSALEFSKERPGEVLSQIFGVTKTTISRIKKGINHTGYFNLFKEKKYEERYSIYKDFCERTDFENRVLNTSQIKTKRKFTKKEVYLILYNFEKRIIPIKKMTQLLNLKSSNTLYTIKKCQSYKNYYISYQKLTEIQKEELVTLLRNLQEKKPLNCWKILTVLDEDNQQLSLKNN